MKPFAGIIGLALLSLWIPCAHALELTVAPGVFGQALERDVFRQQGRLYLVGDAGSGCSYAFLERPRLRLAGGRLVIDAHFSGRAAVEVFGDCVGPGDAFGVTLSGMPFVDGTTLGLTDLRMDSDSDFQGLVEEFVTGELAPLARVDLGAELARLASDLSDSSGYRLGLKDLTLQDVRVVQGRLALRLSLRLDVDAKAVSQ